MIRLADFLPDNADPADWDSDSLDEYDNSKSFEVVANGYSFELELLEPLSEQRHRGPDDYAGIMYARDMIDTSLEYVPEEYREAVDSWLAKVDQRFLELTQEDTAELIARLNPQDPWHPEWWWHRIPLDGPILVELKKFRNFKLSWE